jgi:hypothetical protein
MCQEMAVLCSYLLVLYHARPKSVYCAAPNTMMCQMSNFHIRSLPFSVFMLCTFLVLRKLVGLLWVLHSYLCTDFSTLFRYLCKSYGNTQSLCQGVLYIKNVIQFYCTRVNIRKIKFRLIRKIRPNLRRFSRNLQICNRNMCWFLTSNSTQTGRKCG